MLSFLLTIFNASLRTFFLVLPTLIVVFILQQKAIEFDQGQPIVKNVKIERIHEILPRTRWGNLKACNSYFDEIQEFNKARQCVNEKVYSENPIDELMTIPRCFVIPADSPDVFSKDGLNFLPLRSFFATGAVVGFYDTKTKTLFIVENIDAASTYRHELQHLFIHINEPESQGGGHHQDIWKKCEPPYYEPNEKVKVIRDLEKIYKDLD